MPNTIQKGSELKEHIKKYDFGCAFWGTTRMHNVPPEKNAKGIVEVPLKDGFFTVLYYYNREPEKACFRVAAGVDDHFWYVHHQKPAYQVNIMDTHIMATVEELTQLLNMSDKELRKFINSLEEITDNDFRES